MKGVYCIKQKIDGVCYKRWLFGPRKKKGGYLVLHSSVTSAKNARSFSHECADELQKRYYQDIDSSSVIEIPANVELPANFWISRWHIVNLHCIPAAMVHLGQYGLT